MKPIPEILADNARLYPNETALVEINPQELEARHTTWKEYSLIVSSPMDAFRSEITWAQFEEKANRFANLLLTRGVKKGDKVAILLMNGLEWLPIYFGVLRAGALAVPLNFRYAADEIKYCVDLADASFLVFGPEFIGRVEQISDQLPKVKALFYVGGDCPSFAESYRDLVPHCSSRRPEIPLSLDDDAAIYYSSGTTGFPKAIVLRHRALAQSCEVEQAHHGQTHDDVFLCIPPLYHTGAKMHWFGSFLVGGRAVLLRGVKPEWIVRAVSEEKCSIVWLLVPWAQDILDAIDRGEIDLSEYDLSRWRLMHIGAQPVPPSLIARWRKVFPNHQYDTNYGLSESTGPGCVHLGVENVAHVGAIGVPGHGWETKIVGPAPERAPVAKGEVGELAVRGPGVMKEYYKDPKATAEVLDAEGWLYTGDMGGLHLPGGPQEGRHHHRRREPLPGADRGLPARPRRDQGRGGDRAPGPAPRRDRRGGGRAQGRRGAHRGRRERVLQGPPALQAPAQGHLRAGAPQPDGQDREAGPAQALLRRVARRPAGRPREVDSGAPAVRGRAGSVAAVARAMRYAPAAARASARSFSNRRPYST